MIAIEKGVPVVLADLVAHFSNVQLCGSVWACPVCAPRIREERAREIELGLAVHGMLGGGAGFLTLTTRHAIGQPLAGLFDTMANGFRTVLGSKGWRQDVAVFGLLGAIRAAEITYGPNGWHPHLHALILSETPLSQEAWDTVADRMFPRWSNVLTRAGYGAPDRKHGLTLTEVRSTDDVARYTSKVQEGAHERSVGREMSRSDLKQGRRALHRTPQAILRDFDATGDADDLRLWNEYERATKGRRALTWGRGLKARLAIEEVSDEEIVAEQVGGEVLDVLNRAEWGFVLRTRLRAFILEVAEGERANFDQVVRVIRAEVERGESVGA